MSALPKVEEVLEDNDLESQVCAWQAALNEQHQCDTLSEFLGLDSDDRQDTAPSWRAKLIQLPTAMPRLHSNTVDQRMVEALRDSIGAFGPTLQALSAIAVDRGLLTAITDTCTCMT